MDLHFDGPAESCRHKTSVMLVDDDPTFLKIVIHQMRMRHDDELDIVGIATTGEQSIDEARLLTPEVVLMDLNMPGQGGLWAIPRLRTLFPKTRVIALTFNDGADSRRAVLAAGGTDLVSKAAWKTALIPAIRRAVASRDPDPRIALEG